MTLRWFNVRVFVVQVKQAAMVLDSLTPGCMMKCILTQTRGKRTRQVSIKVHADTLLWSYGNRSMQCHWVSVPQVVPPAGGRDSGSYRPTMSCCMTPMRTTGTRPGWTRGGGSELSVRVSRSRGKLSVSHSHLSSCSGTAAGREWWGSLSRSIATPRCYPAAMPSSTALPA